MSNPAVATTLVYIHVHVCVHVPEGVHKLYAYLQIAHTYIHTCNVNVYIHVHMYMYVVMYAYYMCYSMYMYVQYAYICEASHVYCTHKTTL